jgi:flagellar protein FliO/FliZ
MDSFRLFQAIAALLLVLGLIGLLGWALRRYGAGFRMKRPADGKARLKVIETLPVDARHRLVLIARDGTEHLLLLGLERPLLVESGIPAGEEIR